MPQLKLALAEMPAVALLGPRQVGKTTLALELAESRPSIYLNLGSEADRAKLAEPELYLSQHADKLVILDEIQRTPELFQSLRGLIDGGRRAECGVTGPIRNNSLAQSTPSRLAVNKQRLDLRATTAPPHAEG